MSGSPEFEHMNGKQKAAILMLALGEEQSGQVLKRMSEDEIRDISGAMSLLGPVRSSVVEALLEEFTEKFGQRGGIIGSLESTERMLLKALPADRVSLIMEEIRGPAGRTMWDKLGNVNETVLANYLKNDTPFTPGSENPWAR